MSSSNEPCCLHINDLPEEMLQYIISMLPLCDRKTVSLVCSAWKHHAFSFTSMADVKLRINGFMVEHRDLNILRKSERPYRHLVLSFGHRPCTELDLATVMEILAKLGPNIESFFLMNDCTPRQFKELITRLPNLKLISVNVIDAGNQSTAPQSFPVMKRLRELRVRNSVLINPWMDTFQIAPNIRKLSVNLMSRSNNHEHALNAMKRYGPQLQYLELFVPKARLPFKQLNFVNLHTLKLWGVQCDRDEKLLGELFENLPLLHTALLHFNVSASVLRVICSKCPRLFKLRIKTDGLNGNSLGLLEKLNNLRVLLVDGYIRRDLLEKCSPLKSVEYFSLTKNPIKTGASIEQLSRMVPRLRILKVDLSYGMQMNDAFIQGICTSFNQLTSLIIDAIHICTVGSVELVSPQVFSTVVRLTNLEELTLSCMRLGSVQTITQHDCLFVHFFRACFGCKRSETRPSRLKRLKLKNCQWVMGGNLVNVARIFPLLQYLEVSRCRMITQEDMEVVRKSMPDCVVHYVKWERYYGPAKTHVEDIQLNGLRSYYDDLD